MPALNLSDEDIARMARMNTTQRAAYLLALGNGSPSASDTSAGTGQNNAPQEPRPAAAIAPSSTGSTTASAPIGPYRGTLGPSSTPAAPAVPLPHCT